MKKRHGHQFHRLRFGVLCALVAAGSFPLFGTEDMPAGMVPIPAGEMQPFYRSEPGQRVAVAAFALDARPVSNAEFLAFVQAKPQWRRSAVRTMHADKHYLKHWSGDLTLGDSAHPGDPVVNVSWFTARAYAAWAGKRLPTLAEWELAAAAPGRDGRTPAEVVLAWYARPGATEATAAGSAPFINQLGVEDLHGLVWEWVEDFNSAMTGADSRTREEMDRVRFCGAGALDAADRGDFATFMRYAHRNSLKGRYTGRLLGFRCARDAVPAPGPDVPAN